MVALHVCRTQSVMTSRVDQQTSAPLLRQKNVPAGLGHAHIIFELFLAGQHRHAASMPLHRS